MIFERADGLFRCICGMDVGRDELKSNFVVAQVYFYRIGAFVVHAVHFRIYPPLVEVSMHCLCCPKLVDG